MNFLELAAKLSLDSSDYESGLSKAKRLASSVSSGISKAFKIGAAAMTAATAATVAFGGAAVKTGMEFDKSMSQVAATMGLTMQDMEKAVGSTAVRLNGEMKEFNGTLRDFAQYMGANTAFTATQAADALNYMALAGYTVQESMDMLPNVLNLAAAGAMDLATASDMVTDTQTAFGITFERTNQLVDEMAKAASTGNTSVQQLGEAFLVVGGLAQEMNGGFVQLEDGTMAAVDGLQEMEIMLTAMANAGIKGSSAGTHMRNMLLKLAKPTSEGTKQMKALGVSVFDAEGNMRSMKDIMGDLNGALGDLTQEEKIKAIGDLFNTRDLASAEALLNAVGQDWDEIGESILHAGDNGGAAAQMAKTQLDNLAGDITLMKSAFEGLQIALSDELSPTFREFVQLATGGLSNITQALKGGGVRGAMRELGKTISSGLKMITQKLPEAVEAGRELLHAIGEGLMENMPLIVDTGIEVASTLIQSMISEFPSFLRNGGKILKKIAEGIIRALPEIRQTVRDTMSELARMFENPDTLRELLDAGLEILLSIGEGITENIDSLVTIVNGIVTSICDFITENLDEVADAAIDILSALATGLADNLSVVVPKVIEIITEIVDTLSDPENLSEMTDAAIEIVLALASAIIDNLPLLVEKAPEIVENLVTALVENAPKMQDAAWELVLKLVEGIIKLQLKLYEVGGQLVSRLVNGIIASDKKLFQIGKDIMHKVKEGFMSLISDPIQWGRDMIGKFIEGITQKWEALKSTVAQVGQSIADRIGFSEPKLGPLSNFHTYAPDMMRLFAQGIYDNAHVVTDAIEDTFDFGERFDYQTAASANYVSADDDRLTSEVVSILRDIRANMGFDVVLDDGTIAGRIDKLLGRKAMQAMRGNAYA